MPYGYCAENRTMFMNKSVWAIIQSRSWKKYINWQLNYLIWHSKSLEEIILEKTIYGGKPKNPVAYCALHNGSLTVKEMKKKGCLGKQCHHLQKNEQHEYWDQRQIMKARKES